MNISSDLINFSSIFPKQQILDPLKLKEFANDNFKVAENGSFLNGQKTLWEKEKLLVTSNFSISHVVFKRLVLKTCKNEGLFMFCIATGAFIKRNMVFPVFHEY